MTSNTILSCLTPINFSRNDDRDFFSFKKLGDNGSESNNTAFEEEKEG